jgi:hypothetical protein
MPFHMTATLQLLTFVEQMQDFMRMYSSLVDRCFNSCVNDFTSKAIGSKEVGFTSFLFIFPVFRAS